MDPWQARSDGPEQTRRLGRRLGRLAEPGLEIFLDGELGSGKTCLTQGIAAGLDVQDDEPVTSPTYTLMNQYQGTCRLQHFDLYRLGHPDELVDIDFEAFAGGPGVTVVEWAGQVLDPDRPGLYVRLAHAGDDRRTLTFIARGASAGRLLARLARAWDQQGEQP